MNARDVLGALTPNGLGDWDAPLDAPDHGQMPGPTSITIDTGTDERPSDEELGLARQILDNMAAVVQTCDAMLQTDPAAQGMASSDAEFANPRVWISRESMVETGAGHWTMVIGVDVSSDFAWHIEFDGLRAVMIWAGD